MEIPTNILSTDKQLYTVHRQIDRQVERIIKYKKPRHTNRKTETVRQTTRERANTGVLPIYTRNDICVQTYNTLLIFHCSATVFGSEGTRVMVI